MSTDGAVGVPVHCTADQTAFGTPFQLKLFYDSMRELQVYTPSDAGGACSVDPGGRIIQFWIAPSPPEHIISPLRIWEALCEAPPE